ncbi:hypothetical protein F5B22DRAFT_579390 [Xylaria bambusicola]|uniref:uncharacterized protein n=1 Tax=Xylaria bambusicola TaxID=326684 RepID=UPI002007D0BD|nr:uncharacterized protein F5B22DRAFT_579390 [Xylaria bambusicola]KAI0502983.1 hypothetical protein F5B22DRAFT_579390 [Xylaria bambusicola]
MLPSGFSKRSRVCMLHFDGYPVRKSRVVGLYTVSYCIEFGLEWYCLGVFLKSPSILIIVIDSLYFVRPWILLAYLGYQLIQPGAWRRSYYVISHCVELMFVVVLANVYQRICSGRITSKCNISTSTFTMYSVIYNEFGRAWRGCYSC